MARLVCHDGKLLQSLGPGPEVAEEGPELEVHVRRAAACSPDADLGEPRPDCLEKVPYVAIVLIVARDAELDEVLKRAAAQGLGEFVGGQDTTVAV